MDRKDVPAGTSKGVGNVSKWPSCPVTESLKSCAEARGRPARTVGSAWE